MIEMLRSFWHCMLTCRQNPLTLATCQGWMGSVGDKPIWAF